MNAQLLAVAQVRALGLGRFLGAAVTRVTGDGSDKLLLHSGWELMVAASAREDGRSARN